MSDRGGLGKVGVSIWAATLLTMVALPRSLRAQQVGNAPPPLTQFVDIVDVQRPEATAYAIWNSGETQRHEVWFRVLSGEADFQQRLRVFKEQAAPRSPDTLPPLSTLVYEVENNNPSQWYFLGTESGFFTYYFDGDSRLEGTFDWDNAEAVRVQKTIYLNGDSYIISFEDINALDDYDDLQVEVVLIRR